MYEYLFFPLLDSIQESHFLVTKVSSQSDGIATREKY